MPVLGYPAAVYPHDVLRRLVVKHLNKLAGEPGLFSNELSQLYTKPDFSRRGLKCRKLRSPSMCGNLYTSRQ